jgi:hypothetical protein
MNALSIDPARFRTAASIIRTASPAVAERRDQAEAESVRERGLLTLLLVADLLAP